MPICDDKKLIFIHIPKNAGTSITLQLNMREISHHTWQEYQQRFSKEWLDYKSFAILRDPLKRAISGYEYAKMKKSFWHSFDGSTPGGPHPDFDVCQSMDFNSFIKALYLGNIRVKHECWRTQSSWICDDNGKVMVDLLLDYELLDSELIHHGILDGRLKTLNKSSDSEKAPPYSIDVDTRNMIEKMYAVDYQLISTMKQRKT